VSGPDSETLPEHIERVSTDYCATRHEHTLVVGLTRNGERMVKGFRSPDARYAPVPDGRTLYEIGSVTKVYTTSLLSILVAKGVLSLEDTIGTYYPDVNLKPEIAEITLFDLATHSSGLDGDGIVLDRMIKEAVKSGDFANYTYYERYGLADLHEELEVAQLVRPRGSNWEYSRTGLSILGHILQLATGQSYEELLEQHITGPLGLSDTVCTLSEEQQSRLVHGFSPEGVPSMEWHWGVMLPQGGIRATTDDILTFLEANMADDESQLTADFRRARETEVTWPESTTDAPPFRQALGWMNLPVGPSVITHHGGATFSYMAMTGFDAATKTGVHVATSSEKNLDDYEVFAVFAMQLLIKAVLDAATTR
jgi:CubicO group peptidase (beta-lactamase class C family)